MASYPTLKRKSDDGNTGSKKKQAQKKADRLSSTPAAASGQLPRQPDQHADALPQALAQAVALHDLNTYASA